MKAGAVYKYDLSIPLEHMYNLVEEMRSRLGKEQTITLPCSYIFVFWVCGIVQKEISRHNVVSICLIPSFVS